MNSKFFSALVLLAALAGARLVKAESRFDAMVSPVSNPVNFEDPRSLTEIRPIYIYHKLDNKFVTEGGNVQIFALQLRYAINDSLSIIANKDGYVLLRPNAVLDDENGFGNVEAGLKYTFLKDEDSGMIAAGGLTYQAPVGTERVLQGEGDGAIRPFFSAGFAGENVNFLASTGFRFRMNSHDSSFYDLDLHLDTPICDFYPGIEFNLVHVLSDGDRLPIADEGADYFNFGSANASGENIATGAVVARYKFTDAINYGVAYQFPLNSGSGTHVFDWRITTDLIVSF